MRGVTVSACVLFATFALATCLPSEGTPTNKETESPEISNEVDDDFPTFDDEKTSDSPFMLRLIGGLGRLFSGFMQLPSLMARAFNFFVASQPFSRLREEVRNLNISYPKTGLIF